MPTWYLLLALAFIVANGVFVAAEFAIIKVRPTQLAELAAAGSSRARMARRITGNRDTNTGSQFGSASAFFFNPAVIKSITTDLVVQDIEESPCIASPGSAG